MKQPHIAGVGADVERVARFGTKKFLSDTSLLNTIYTPGELKYCLSKRRPAQHLAARFAAKEAAWKALARGRKNLPLSLFLRQVEVTNHKDGSPSLKFCAPRFKKYTAMISLSHSKTHAFAVVVLTT